MPQFYKLLTPIDDQKDTFYLEDVLKHMSAHHRKRLHEWLNGRVTLVLIDNQEIILRDDLDKFFDTL